MTFDEETEEPAVEEAAVEEELDPTEAARREIFGALDGTTMDEAEAAGDPDEENLPDEEKEAPAE
jgi:hypothetical protein